MNTGKRIAALLLIFVLFCCKGLEAYAATESQDGLSVTLTTDKQSYLPGEAINVSLLLTNGNSFPISSVHAQVSAPDGYILAAGYAESMSTASLGAGKSLQLAIRYLEQNSVPVPLPTLGPDRVGVATGDQANLPLWIALAVVSLAALMLLALRKKIWKRFFCLLLCFVMLGGIAGPVYAANDQAQKTLRVATPVKVGNRDLTVQGVVSYTMGSEVSPSPTPTTVPSPTPTAQPSPTPAPSPSPSPSPVPGEYFTVSYQLNYEGAGEYLSQQVEKGSCAVKPNDPTRAEYRFMGWKLDTEYTAYDFQTPVSSNLTLNAVWSHDVGEDDSIYILSDERISFDETAQIYYVNNMIYAFIKPSLSQIDKEEISRSVNGMIEAEISGALNILQIQVKENSIENLERLASTLEGNPNVTYATYDIPMKEENVLVFSGAETSVNQTVDNWWYEEWGIQYVWDNYEKLIAPITIGVIDYGVDDNHEDLDGKVTFASDVFSRFNSTLKISAKYDTSVDDGIDHGTEVVGLIAAHKNDYGITGVNPNSNIVFASTKLSKFNDADWWSSIYPLKALKLEIEKGAKVINCSFGVHYFTEKVSEDTVLGNSEQGERNRAFMLQNITEATCYLLRYGYKNKFLIFAAAGNGENNSGPGVDASLSATWTGITEENSESIRKTYGITFEELKSHYVVVSGILASHDGTVYQMHPALNYGNAVDIYASGDDTYSTSYNAMGDKYDSFWGATSMAAPVVTGVASLVWAVNPNLTSAQVREILLNNTRFSAQGTYGGTTYTRPVVDAKLAVEEALRRYDHRIFATVTDGTNPLSGVTAELHCVASNSDEKDIQVPVQDDGTFIYDVSQNITAATIIFKKEGYRDYKYSQELDMSSFNDLGEIVLSLIPVFDTMEIQATLLDAETGETVTGALIQAFSEEQETPVAEAVSNDKGYFTIALPQFTTLSLKITCEGYTARELSIFLEGDSWTGDEEPGGEEAGSILYLQKAGAFEGFAGGDGTANNPYQIATAAQMDAVRRNLSASYVLIDDIDLSTYSPWVPIGTETAPFTGSLNGDDHTISNLTFNNLSVSKWMESNGGRSQNAFIGLFGFVQDALLTALALENVDTEITDNAAVSVGTMYYGSICGWTNNWVDYCTASGSINISMEKASFVHAGGLVGYATGSQAQIDNNVNSASLTIRGGGIVCGGVVGTIDGKIFFCQNYGEINCHNTNGPDLLCGGVVGSALNSNVERCRNFGEITSKTEGWGWPSSGNYRHQTGGVVGLFRGASSAGNTLRIEYCENSGNINVTSFTGYNIANSCCENDSTGGICGGFVCLSSSKWYGEIINCINYATSIRVQRVKDADGTLEYSDSLSIGRIGPFDSLSIPYYSYSNNSSDPATLLNGAVCTENIGAETKNGANLGEEDSEEETGELNISILEGTWSNGLPEDNYSGFYLTEFGSDGTVVQKGYRNIDRGRFEITGANTAVATFGDNYYDTTGVGYQKIADYSYTVTYTYDKYSDTLLADYSDVFENAANSNACDGTLSRWSGTPLHEQIKDIVLGTQEDDTPEQEPQDYQSFLTSQAYLDYAEGWNGSGETYAILDINQDGVDELIVNSPNNSGFMYSLVFTQNYEGQIVRLANEYHYGYIRYSAEHSAIEYSELNPTPDLGSSGFYAMSGAGLALIFSISWDNSEGTENSQIYYPSSGESVPISAEERQAYFASLQNLNWVSLT